MSIQLVMIIDTKRCIGCHTCSLACKSGNNLPVDIWRNRVQTIGGKTMDTPAGVYPDLKMSFQPVTCQHCAKPACVEVCPVKATQKREKDGIVTVDTELCIGCGSCIEACPYEGVRQMNLKNEFTIAFPVGDVDAPVHRPDTVEKCDFCAHRLDRDDMPRCMGTMCPARARHYGDIKDPELAKLLKNRKYYQLQVKDGTGPSIYYLT